MLRAASRSAFGAVQRVKLAPVVSAHRGFASDSAPEPAPQSLYDQLGGTGKVSSAGALCAVRVS